MTTCKVIRASIAPVMKYAESPWKYRCDTASEMTEMPSNLFFAENRIDYDANLGGGKFTAIQTGKYKNFDKGLLAAGIENGMG